MCGILYRVRNTIFKSLEKPGHNVFIKNQLIGVIETGPNNPEAIGSQLEASKGL
jgi:hypothetical protein